MFYKTLIIQSKLWNTQVNRSELVWLVESRPSSQQHTLFSARNPVILSNKSSKYLWITIKWKSMVISSLCVNKYILASGNRLTISLFQALLRCNAPYAIPLPPGSLAEPVREKNIIIELWNKQQDIAWGREGRRGRSHSPCCRSRAGCPWPWGSPPRCRAGCSILPAQTRGPVLNRVR